MASIKCTNCGATLKTPTAVPAGKKVKCPKCGKPFVVEDEEEEEEPEETETDSDADEQEEEAPAPKKPVKKPVKVQDEEEEDSEEEESEEEEEAPKKSPAKKPGKSKTGDAPKGGSKMLLIIVGVTLTLCCLGCGTVGYLFQATIKGIIGLGDAVSKDLKKINEELTKDKNKPADKTKIDKTEVAPPAILKADFVLSAIEFTDEFEANENAAEKKFTGKVVELTGDVSEVVFFGAQKKLGISLNPPGWTINIPIHPSAHAKVYRLSKGQSVKVVAAYKGSFGRILSLDESTLTEKAPSQIVEVTSENLAAAYEKLDFGKYDQKTLLVTGPVLERGKAKDGPEFAQLKGGKKLVVQVNGNTLGSLEVDKLAKGSTAVLRVNHARLDEANNRLILSGIVVIESK